MAHYLGAKSYFIHYFKGKRRRIVYALLKYVLAFFKTLTLLHKEHPDVIFVQTPPIFAVLVVWLYCLLHESKYVVDTHSATFTDRRWVKFLWLYRFLAKRALTNMLHNKPLERRVADWGAPAIALEDGPPILKTDRTYPFCKGFNVVVISSYGNDEPTYEVIEAARYLRTVNFYITGSLSYAPKEILMNVPDNVVLTDYLLQMDYTALLMGCDVAVCLTIHDYKMQCGAHEALELGRPIITSDWPVLREFFSRGTIHIDNSASSLAKAIEKIRSNYSSYFKEIKILREERRADWEKKFSNFIELLNKYNKEDKE
jgi:glycosyltransferase involved in cell wall biosynthesis